jgi:signal transduction histidine kinase
MKPLDFRTAVYLTFDVALLIVCFLHVPSLIDRPAVPFDARLDGDHVLVTRVVDGAAAGSLSEGDRIIRWEGEPVAGEHDLEFLADFRAVGEKVALGVARGGIEREVSVRLIPFYGAAYVIIVLFVGVIAWALGVYIMIDRPHQPAAGVLQWSLVCMGVSTMLAWGATPPGDPLVLLSRGTFFIVYMGVGSLFILFTTMFPRPRFGAMSAKAAIIGLPSLLVLVPLLITHFTALTTRSAAAFAHFHGWFDAFQVLKLVFVGGGLFTVISSYVTTESTGERKRLQWILWGLAIGPTPFLFLITIPELIHSPGVVPEEATLIFLVVIPIAFAISFVKYRVLDIEVVIKRTTVYGLVLASVVVMYTLLLGTVSAYVGTFTRGISVLAAVLIALLFEPVRRGVQRFVDRKFFHVQYVFREAGRRFLADIEGAADERELGELVVLRTAEVLPVERMGLFLASQPSGRLRVCAQRGFELLEKRGIPFDRTERGIFPVRSMALAEYVEQGVEIGRGDPSAFLRWGIAVAFPVPGAHDTLPGFLVLGPKRSGERFTAEDIDLFSQVAVETGLALERIILQRRLVLEQAEGRRLEELNKLKSDFVSYVSHELRTPLTSITMFAELLRSPRLRLGRTPREYARIIEGEAQRLGRMVSVILDSARIEQGEKEYRLEEIDLVPVVRKAMEAMAFQLTQGKFRVVLRLPRRPLLVLADRDAVIQAVVNLVANAVKYSALTKYVAVRLSRDQTTVRCAVTDKGRGIPAESLERIFQRFYREPGVKELTQGVGLGLPLVRHIMEAHHGRVEVVSAPGKGSTFVLVFPGHSSHHLPSGVRQ